MRYDRDIYVYVCEYCGFEEYVDNEYGEQPPEQCLHCGKKSKSQEAHDEVPGV